MYVHIYIHIYIYIYEGIYIYEYIYIYMYIYDLYSGNMQSALEHGCGKQTPSASKSFFRANVLHVSNVKHIAHLQMCYMFVMSKCRKESDHIAHLQKCYMFLIHVYPHMQMCYMFVMLGSLKE